MASKFSSPQALGKAIVRASYVPQTTMATMKGPFLGSSHRSTTRPCTMMASTQWQQRLEQRPNYGVTHQRTIVVVTKTSVGSSLDATNLAAIAAEQTSSSSSNQDLSPPEAATPVISGEDGTEQGHPATVASAVSDLIITPSCMEQIRSLAARRKDNLKEVYLRVYVDAGGCSGFQYKFELTRDQDEAVDGDEDIVYAEDATRVVIDKGSLDLLQGSTIDYVQEMIKSAFSVTHNPQSESACGCGSSFAIKNFESNPAMD